MSLVAGPLDAIRAALYELVRWGGYVVLVAIVFTETGLLVGFFLPGDSLLITAGLVAAAGGLDIWLLNGLLIVAAIAGDSVGYAIGYRTGPHIFTREESLLVQPARICADARVLRAPRGEDHRPRPVHPDHPDVRAGRRRRGADGVPALSRLQRRSAASGGSSSMTWAGYLLGRTIPDIGRYIHIVIGVVIVLSVIPIGVEWWRARARGGDAVARPR